jgi:transposase
LGESNDIATLKELVTVLLTRITQLESVYTDLQSRYGVLDTSYGDLQMAHDDLQTRFTALEIENVELRNRLNLNSQNSHKPPSTDGLTKKPALPKAKGGKSGGQFGHKGTTLKIVATPDHIIVHHLPTCPCCSKVFEASDVERTIQKRQVFDIPPPRLEVTEHQLGIITCCGLQHVGIFPNGVNSPVQYGTKIKALSVLLNTDYKIPFDKIEQLFTDIYDCSFNESTAITVNNTFFEALAPIESIIKAIISATKVVHFDETGMRVEGKLHWFHTACTVLFTYLFVHPKRGKEALLSDESLIKDFKNWAIHDCWKSYFDFKSCYHALCNAHIIRELENLIELGSTWAPLMKKLLFELYKLSEKGTVNVPNKQIWIEKYQIICQKADKDEPLPIQGPRGKPKSTKGRNLFNRLTEHQDGVLAFAFIDDIPFTNNQAERDIRCLKTKQKVANSFRKLKGAQNYARIQGFISSVRKHKMNVFQQIINVFDNKQVRFSNT